MKEWIKKNKIAIIVIAVILLLVAIIFVIKQAVKYDNENWVKLGYESTQEQTHELKMYEFGMDYCDACTAVEPTYRKVRQQYKNEMDFEYIDVNLKPNLANKYNVNAVPAFIIVDKEGNAISRITGVSTFEEFELFIQKAKEVYHELIK